MKTKNSYAYFQYEPIKWRVLKASNGEGFLLSEKILDFQVYHKRSEPVIWKESLIREWLNQDFLQMAFLKQEVKAILKTDTSDKKYGIKSTDTIQDNVFLPDISDLNAKKDGVKFGFVEALEESSEI